MREAASAPVKQRMTLLQDVLGELQHAKTHQVCDAHIMGSHIRHLADSSFTETHRMLQGFDIGGLRL